MKVGCMTSGIVFFSFRKCTFPCGRTNLDTSPSSWRGWVSIPQPPWSRHPDPPHASRYRTPLLQGPTIPEHMERASCFTAPHPGHITHAEGLLLPIPPVRPALESRLIPGRHPMIRRSTVPKLVDFKAFLQRSSLEYGSDLPWLGALVDCWFGGGAFAKKPPNLRMFSGGTIFGQDFP